MRGEMPSFEKSREGVWSPYTPIPGGTNWDSTSATTTGAYMVIGGTCFWQQSCTLGPSSSISAFALPSLSLPFPVPSALQRNTQVDVELIDAGTSTWFGVGGLGSAGVTYYALAGGGYATLGPTTPFAWANGDSFASTGWYRLAT